MGGDSTSDGDVDGGRAWCWGREGRWWWLTTWLGVDDVGRVEGKMLGSSQSGTVGQLKGVGGG